MAVRVGVLALQGSFQEHCTCLRAVGVDAVEIRKEEELDTVRGLIIPGGESTTMALVAERWGLIEPLREFAGSGRPIWGTCAGLIFLAKSSMGQKEGGQVLIGGLDVTVSRNFFGSQINSFEAFLPAPGVLGKEVDGDASQFRAMFIRAPAILDHGPAVEVLGELPVDPKVLEGMLNVPPHALEHNKVVVAVREGSLLATSFHPELTSDTRWHRLFKDMVEAGPAAKSAAVGDKGSGAGRAPNAPVQLPVWAAQGGVLATSNLI